MDNFPEKIHLSLPFCWSHLSAYGNECLAYSWTFKLREIFYNIFMPQFTHQKLLGHMLSYSQSPIWQFSIRWPWKLSIHRDFLEGDFAFSDSVPFMGGYRARQTRLQEVIFQKYRPISQIIFILNHTGMWYTLYNKSPVWSYEGKRNQAPLFRLPTREKILVLVTTGYRQNRCRQYEK